MEFLVLASRYVKQPERERVVLQAVVEAAEAVGVERIVVRRGNVYSTGVYLKDEKGKSLLYNDWDKDWGWRRIYSSMISSIRLPPDRERRILLAT